METLSDTQVIRMLSAAYDTGTRRIDERFRRIPSLEIPDRYADQIDIWFDACDLLQIEVEAA
jgi:hypothetical protein